MPSSACPAALRAPPAFPTRRSSDLAGARSARRVRQRRGRRARGAVRDGASVHGAAPRLRRARHTGRLCAARDRVRSSRRRRGEGPVRSEEHTSELQSRSDLVCRLLLAPPPSALPPLSLHDALPISRALVPLVVSASVAAGVHAALFGTGPLFTVPHHDFAGLGTLGVFALLGIACGLLAVVVAKGL